MAGKAKSGTSVGVEKCFKKTLNIFIVRALFKYLMTPFSPNNEIPDCLRIMCASSKKALIPRLILSCLCRCFTEYLLKLVSNGMTTQRT